MTLTARRNRRSYGSAEVAIVDPGRSYEVGFLRGGLRSVDFAGAPPEEAVEAVENAPQTPRFPRASTALLLHPLHPER